MEQDQRVRAETELDELVAELATHREHGPGARREHTEARDRELDEREQDLDRREQALDERERILDERADPAPDVDPGRIDDRSGRTDVPERDDLVRRRPSNPPLPYPDELTDAPDVERPDVPGRPNWHDPSVEEWTDRPYDDRDDLDP